MIRGARTSACGRRGHLLGAITGAPRAALHSHPRMGVHVAGGQGTSASRTKGRSQPVALHLLRSALTPTPPSHCQYV
ncbi:MAG: hypothetical protein OJF49_004356 [Ktedonobacterales bacterium]|nr:MAG: hypothetical protein OJF49_004356 [Ktedonobacterales bacterium]